jgi:uncharacterized membrane protein YozB (DUF420 family)
MTGLLGTKASISSDLNLLLQIFLLIVLLAGLRLGKKKTGSSLKMHGRLMFLLVALNGLSIIFVMGPSLLFNLGAVVSEVSGGFPLTLFHHSIGLIAEILGIVLVFKKFGNVRYWMRIEFVIWFISLLLGISFYLIHYVV